MSEKCSYCGETIRTPISVQMADETWHFCGLVHHDLMIYGVAFEFEGIRVDPNVVTIHIPQKATFKTYETLLKKVGLSTLDFLTLIAAKKKEVKQDGK